MKTKTNKHKNSQSRSIHQHVEYFFRHRAMLTIMLGVLVLGIISLDSRFRNIMRDAYAQGFAWMGTYMHHEHPAHSHMAIAATRLPTIGGRG